MSPVKTRKRRPTRPLPTPPDLRPRCRAASAAHGPTSPPNGGIGSPENEKPDPRRLSDGRARKSPRAPLWAKRRFGPHGFPERHLAKSSDSPTDAVSVACSPVFEPRVYPQSIIPWGIHRAIQYEVQTDAARAMGHLQKNDRLPSGVNLPRLDQPRRAFPCAILNFATLRHARQPSSAALTR